MTQRLESRPIMLLPAIAACRVPADSATSSIGFSYGSDVQHIPHRFMNSQMAIRTLHNPAESGDSIASALDLNLHIQAAYARQWASVFAILMCAITVSLVMLSKTPKRRIHV